jgi:elongator complex protein 1
MDSNIIDASFSRSGSRIAVLTRTNFFVFSWSLKERPVPAPLLESSHPLSEASFSRPRQITFLQDNEIIVLNHVNPHQRQIERTKLETRITETIYCATTNVQLYSIFPNITHDTLWLASRSNRGPTIYSTVAINESNNLQVTTWNDGPAVETHWAEATHTHTDFVSSDAVGCRGE